MDGYKKTLDVLGDLAREKKLDSADRRFFAEKMVDVATKMASFDTNNKSFLASMTTYVTCFIGGVLILGAIALGIRFKGRKIEPVKKSL